MNKLKNILHIIECIIADWFFGFPGEKITIIAVTGTDGKTTTSHAIANILSYAGIKYGLISTTEIIINDNKFQSGSHTTTPRPWMVRRYMKQAIENDCQYFILETTSHAIVQNRIWNLPIKFGILTNITQEHGYHHRTFNEYLNLKVSLLLKSEIAIINADCAQYDNVRQIFTAANKKFISYSISGPADFNWDKSIKTDLIGRFNQENVLAAFCWAKTAEISHKYIIDGIKNFKLPKGRLDIVYDRDFKVMIDFAHTPNAVNQLLSAIKNKYRNQYHFIIHVFGAASQRDDAKRPLLGQASSDSADIIILTEEDRRFEDFDRICTQIEKGINGFDKVNSAQFLKIDQKKIYTMVKDRGQAIQMAIKKAKKDDIVIITGKSHESSINRDGIEIPWDEYEVVKQAIQNKYEN